MTKVKDIWTPKKLTREQLRVLFKHVPPKLELKIGKDGIEAEVEFYFFNLTLSYGFSGWNKTSKKDWDDAYHKMLEERGIEKKADGSYFTHNEKAQFKRTIKGPSDEVYILATRQASQIGLVMKEILIIDGIELY